MQLPALPGESGTVVTNEVGMGIVPENRLARHFRDIAGQVEKPTTGGSGG